MRLHNLFLSTLAFPPTVSALPTLRGFLDFDDNERHLRGNSEVCDSPKTLYYNMFFTLFDLSPLQNATAQCEEGDYTDIGMLIQDIVKQIDQDFPQYKNEFIDSSVCAVPVWSMGEAQNGNRALLEELDDSVHRRLGTYRYRAGGTCRRCTGRRRQLHVYPSTGYGYQRPLRSAPPGRFLKYKNKTKAALPPTVPAPPGGNPGGYGNTTKAALPPTIPAPPGGNPGGDGNTTEAPLPPPVPAPPGGYGNTTEAPLPTTVPAPPVKNPGGYGNTSAAPLPPTDSAPPGENPGGYGNTSEAPLPRTDPAFTGGYAGGYENTSEAPLPPTHSTPPGGNPGGYGNTSEAPLPPTHSTPPGGNPGVNGNTSEAPLPPTDPAPPGGNPGGYGNTSKAPLPPTVPAPPVGNPDGYGNTSKAPLPPTIPAPPGGNPGGYGNTTKAPPPTASPASMTRLPEESYTRYAGTGRKSPLMWWTEWKDSSGWTRPEREPNAESLAVASSTTEGESKNENPAAASPTASPTRYDILAAALESSRTDDSAVTMTASEAAAAACNMASTGKFALAVCETGYESCQDVLKDIADLVPQHPNAQKATADQSIAADKCDRIRTIMEDASSASATANDACSQAEEKARLGEDEWAIKEMLDADAASKIAAGAAIEVQGVFAQAKQVKHDLMREIVEANFQARDEALKKMLADAEVTYQKVIGEIEAEVKRLEEAIAKQPIAMEVQKLNNETATLTEVLNREKRRYEEVKKAAMEWTKEVTNANEFGKMMDKYNYALATANSLDEWLEDYRQLLQTAIPKFLYDEYNTTDGGCLDPDFEDYFNVKVEIVQVADKASTLSKNCELPYFEV